MLNISDDLKNYINNLIDTKITNDIESGWSPVNTIYNSGGGICKYKVHTKLKLVSIYGSAPSGSGQFGTIPYHPIYDSYIAVPIGNASLEAYFYVTTAGKCGYKNGDSNAHGYYMIYKYE